ncbi:hypothetical protein, partial [Providencia alcalifaciens]|uniref:hypothetical protein n=1 Tax=Providencia alcalifaciens TaxID=126385 RepID=UPI002B056D3F
DKKDRDNKKREELKAIRTVLGFEAYSILRQIAFFVDLNRDLKGMVEIKIEVMPKELWRQVKIYCQKDGNDPHPKILMVPAEPNMIGHEFIVNAIKLDPSIYNNINMLNQCMLTLNTYIDSCIGFISNNEPKKVVTIARLVADTNQVNGKNLVVGMLKILYFFREDMSNFIGFESLYSKINSHYNIDPDKI